MSKIYFDALDRRNGKLTAALSCLDKDTAFRVFQEVGNSLEINGHGGSLVFDYGITDGKIEYKPYTKQNWFKKQSEASYLVVAKFDADDFTIAELLTKKSIAEMSGHYRNEIGHDIWFIVQFFEMFLTK